MSFKLQNQKQSKQEMPSTQASSIGEVIEELRSVIETPALRQLFLKHLEMEYSVENLSVIL
jgi:phage-related protein